MTLYYVKNGGSDAADGLSDGNAWETIAKVNGVAFSAGDSVLFKKGSTWREQLTVPSSGSEGSPITFGAYGSGDDPVLNEADIVTGWTLNSVLLLADTACQAAWLLEDATPTTDSSVNGYTLTAVNGASVSGGYFVPANNVIFTRADSAGLDGMANATFYAKIMPHTISLEGFLSKRNTAGQKSWGLRVSSGTIEVFLSSDGTAEDHATHSAASSIVADTDYTIIVTLDGTTNQVKIYIDGTQSGSTGSWTGPIFDGTSTLRIGCDGDGNEMQGGRIYETGIFTKVLSATEISSLHTNGLASALSDSGSTTVYYKAWGSNDVVAVQDTTRLAKGTSTALSSGYFYQTAGKLYIRCTDDAAPSTHTMQIANRTYGIDGNGQDYITVDGLSLKYTKDVCIMLNGATNWVIQNNTFTAPRPIAIYTTTAECAPLTISNNTFTDAGQETMYFNTASLTAGAVNITGNTITGGGWNLSGESDAIDLKESNTTTVTISNNVITQATFQPSTSAYGVSIESAATITQNIITNPVRAGINVGCSGATVTKNYIIQTRATGNPKEHGIYFSGDNHTINYNLIICTGTTTDDSVGLMGGFSTDHTGCNIYNNVVMGHKVGFYNDGDLTTCNLKNNIFYEYTQRGINLGNTPTSLTSDYNDIYSTQGGSVVGHVGGVDKTTLANWQSTGYDTHSINSDPLFVNPGTDFHLQATSPCINAGVDVSLTEDYSGFPVPYPPGGTPDIGSYEYKPPKSIIIHHYGGMKK